MHPDVRLAERFSKRNTLAPRVGVPAGHHEHETVGTEVDARLNDGEPAAVEAAQQQ
jgi:hypothetical protein